MHARKPQLTQARGLRIALLSAALCLPLAPAGAQERIALNMRNADISAVLQWLSEATGKRIVVDPRVRGQVTILTRDAMTPAEALEVVTTALGVYGYTAIEDGEILQVVPQANLKTGTTRFLDALQPAGADLPVNQVITLRNLPASAVAESLRPLMPAHASLIALPGSNGLLVTDTRKSVQRITQLADELDRNAAIDLDVVPLRHASADKLVDVLSQLLGADSKSLLQMVPEERVNAIVLAGSPAMRAKARDLIDRLDRDEVAEGQIQVVYLHYLKAEEMVGVLKGMIESKQEKDTAPRSPVAIEASESTNALVISAPPDRLEELLGVVRKLDIRRAQVLVEAIIAEVGDNASRDLGVEWRTAFNGSGTEAITRFGPGGVTVQNRPLADVGSGLTVGYFHNGSLRALLRALESTTDTNILSTPSIVTLDNQEAEILVGSNVPFKTGESLTRADTAGGGAVANPFTTIEREDVGVTLKVTPQVNQGDTITLDILQKVETITDSTEAEDIITDKRSVQTRVLLGDDDILVLGGLSQNEMRETVQKVPLLGDIPLLGHLFKRTNRDLTKRNLMVFVRTRILTDFATAEQETLERYNRVREAQIRHGSQSGSALLKDQPVLPELPPAAK